MKTFALFSCCFSAMLTTGALAQDRVIIRGGESNAKEVSIDELFGAEKLWTKTVAEIETEWKDKGFKWNSEQMKDRGIIRRENWGFQPLKIIAFESLTVEEVGFVFKGGKLVEIALLPWTKGDSQNSQISEKAFGEIVDAWTAELDKRIAPEHQDRGPDKASAARAERRMWIGKETLAQLEYSGDKERFRNPYTGRQQLPEYQGDRCENRRRSGSGRGENRGIR